MDVKGISKGKQLRERRKDERQCLSEEIKKKKKKLELKVIGDPAILQQSALQCSNETQMEVPENSLPQPSSDDMAEPVFQRSWQHLSVLRNGCDTAGTVVHTPDWQSENLLPMWRQFQ